MPKSYDQKSYISKNSEPRNQITVSTNPFEAESYDEKMNPFMLEDDDELDKTNPFREDYDCDKNLNPFN